MRFDLNKYSIYKKVASNEISELFLATRLQDNRAVMIKRTAIPSEQDARFQERFQNDIRAVTPLKHKNIISTFEYGLDAKTIFTVTEYINGCDFSTVLSDHSFYRPVGLMILADGLQALHTAHTKGIGHCNFTPASLLIEQSGRVVVTDLGMPLFIDKKNNCYHFATPFFIPPEQAALISPQLPLREDQFDSTSLVKYTNNMTNENFQSIHRRSIQWDIWAAGVLMYRICSGQYPFRASTFPDLLKTIIYGDPSNIFHVAPDVPNTIAAIIKQCLQKEPHLRPASLDPIINVLQEFFFTQGISNFDEVIANYLKEKPALVQFAAEPEYVSQNSSVNNSADALNQQALETQKLIELTSYDKQSEPSDTQAAYQQNHRTTHVESGWEFYEYKTLHYTPTRSNQISKNAGSIFSFPLKVLTFLSNGIGSLGDLIYSMRAQLLPVAIVLIVLSITVISGLFISKKMVKKRGKIGNFSVLNNKRKSDQKQETEMSFYIPDTVEHSTGIITSDTDSNSAQPEKRVHESSKNSFTTPGHTIKTSTPHHPVATLDTKKSALPHPAKGKPSNNNISSLKKPKYRSSKVSMQTVTEVPTPAPIIEVPPGTIKISIDPPSAQVFINGTLFNVNEIVNGKKVPEGNYTITAEADGYQSYHNTVQIEPDKTVILTLQLKPNVKGNGQVHIYSYPWANLFIDGTLSGTTPTAAPLVLPEGSHKLELKRDGYQAYIQDVTVKASEVVRLQVQLKKIGE